MVKLEAQIRKRNALLENSHSSLDFKDKIITKGNNKLSSKRLRRNLIRKPLQINIWLEFNTTLGTNYGGYTKNQMSFQCVSGPICTKDTRNHFKKTPKMMHV